MQATYKGCTIKKHKDGYYIGTHVFTSLQQATEWLDSKFK